VTLWIWIPIRIGNPDPGARKLRNFQWKNAIFDLLKKITLKSYKIALILFEKILVNNTGIFYLI
jgi:hypothetical protein